MKKILIFAVCCIMTVANFATAGVRDGNAVSRRTSDDDKAFVSAQKLVATRQAERSTTSGRTVLKSQNSGNKTVSRTNKSGTNGREVAVKKNIVTRATVTSNSRASNSAPRSADTVTGNSAKSTKSVVSRAVTNDTTSSGSRVGAEYEKCKSAYFACMDQFCQLKSDTYRRCSCNDRVYEFDESLESLQQAGEQLTVFTENLEVVGMTAAQASSMRNSSEGENALTADTSASKALLQAIMNSIRGESASVSGKYSDLNSISLSFDTANIFGELDSAQVVAAYNGQNLYTAVYPKCRQIVQSECNDASLQRAVTAYLMAIEQDCNTVQTAVENKQKEMKASIREGSAMLDLARVENRKNHNSADFTECVNAVENAILSEEVCGANYHRCLDNGEYIDVSTGKPITGVINFYKLGEMLVFDSGTNAVSQTLSKIPGNWSFVQNFENRTKMFAQSELDKCTENAEEVWAEYLDRALLSIYYAQQDKVKEIKQGCFDFISSCYEGIGDSLSDTLSGLSDGQDVVLKPDQIVLNSSLCQDYIDSCDNMFDGNIIQQYIDNRQYTDVKVACRAVVQQCFEKFGGSGFQNFYYPYSGTFSVGEALDWFSLYDCTSNVDNCILKSECAKQLENIDSCSDQNLIEEVFGGFDKYYVDDLSGAIVTTNNSADVSSHYGLKRNSGVVDYKTRPAGVATEVYNQIIAILSEQCRNMDGRFVKYHTAAARNGGGEGCPNRNNNCTNGARYDPDDICIARFWRYGHDTGIEQYQVGAGENMCPKDYGLAVDTQSWGACLCWENGGRRSRWAQTSKCEAVMYYTYDNNSTENTPCSDYSANKPTEPNYTWSSNGISYNNGQDIDKWCTAYVDSNTNQVCDFQSKNNSDECYKGMGSSEVGTVPDGITDDRL